MFCIRFTREKFFPSEPGEKGRMGLLRLGNVEERFVSHFWEWAPQKYMEHWRDALKRVLDGNPSALITDMRTPAQSSHLVWYPMWRFGDEVIFHNQLLFFKQYGLRGSRLNTQSLLSLVGKRKTHEDGVPLSEWIVPVSDIKLFLKRRSQT